MNDFLGRGSPLAKFLSLTLTVLLTAVATALIMMGRPLLALAAAVIAGYAISIYLDVFRDEFVAQLREDRRERP
ncbi:MAG: hypothetical protein WD009_14360 [Phycisphaeraceae bacterium]